MSESLELATFELDQRKAKAYAESGYWPDARSVARAFVKLEAGRALGLNPIVAMSEVSVINERPTLGAGALASLVKSSGRYDYRVVELSNDTCSLRFFERGQTLGESTFTMADAKQAGLDKRNPTYHQYPRNMLFARAMSNGVAWYCPDVTNGRMYVPEDFPDNLEGYEPPVEQPYDPDPDDYANGSFPTEEAEDVEFGPRLATLEQKADLNRLIRNHPDQERDWAAWMEQHAGSAAGSELTHENAQQAIDILQSEIEGG